jgi:hypothetical protein
VYHASGLITRAKSFLMTKTLSDYRFNHGTRSHLGNFVQAVRTGERLNAGVEDGYKSALLCHLGNISLRTGQTISCDPRTGQIIGNAKAKRLWQRDYDKRWMRQFMTDLIEPSVEYSPSFSNIQ